MAGVRDSGFVGISMSAEKGGDRNIALQFSPVSQQMAQAVAQSTWAGWAALAAHMCSWNESNFPLG